MLIGKRKVMIFLVVLVFFGLVSLAEAAVTCSSTCLSSAQVASETQDYQNGVSGAKCLFIYNNQIYRPPTGTISSGKHKNLHSCGADVTGIMQANHISNPSNYLTPYICAPLCAQSTCQDSDGDGYTASSCGGNDCNDNNANIAPGKTETCNNIDDNCDGSVDNGISSQQSSCGIGACSNTVTQTCSAGVFSPSCVPGNPITEICANNIDDDCDGSVDEICNSSVSNSTSNMTTNLTTCTSGAIQQCGINVGICKLGNQTCSNGQWSSCVGGIVPITEICGNFLDDDCDGKVDEGNCKCTSGAIQQCGINVGICKLGNQTCSNGQWSSCVGSIEPIKEVCNELDDDCDGKVDEEDICLKKIDNVCTENWTCTEWSSCKNFNSSVRNCTDMNSCESDFEKPSTTKSCYGLSGFAPVLIENENDSDWNLLLISIILISIMGVTIAWLVGKTAKE